MFSREALEEYAAETPGFNWREYEGGPDFGREIERTDPKMINIVRRIGKREASDGDCMIDIKLVPWDARHNFKIVHITNDPNDHREKVIVQKYMIP